MINPINLIKPDELKNEKGSVLDIGQLPDYDIEDYDLSNPKDFTRYLSDIKKEIRGSFEYKEMIKYLKNFGGMDRSGINPNISNTDSNKIKIEIHHTPLTLEDITRIVYEKRLAHHEDLSVEMVAKEVMEDHYKNLIGLYPLSSTEHELVHGGYLFIPPSHVYGRPDLFEELYSEFIDDEQKETLESIREHEKDFNPDEQNKIISQSNIYINPSGSYMIPDIESLSSKMSGRIDTIKNNMYSLPILNENITENLREAITFENTEEDGKN